MGNIIENIGSERFLQNTKQTLGIRAKGRRVLESGEEAYQLREQQVSYPVNFVNMSKFILTGTQ